jgi:hemolysin-activating ACP:hemolysin acyltransferase|tara:strand:+ start:207 stop:656 length:450 start_codon:yes stop_codon:yes gene_type:complete
MDNKAKDLQEVIRLYQDQYIWQHMTQRELADYLVPCIALNQYHIFRYDNTGVAYAFTNWAFMNEEAEKRFKETGVIEKFDWDSGKNVWHIDTINNHNGKINEIYKWTAENFLKILPEETEVNWIRLTKSGDRIKRVNKMKIKDGVRKFK